jgi:hypothetical protein
MKSASSEPEIVDIRKAILPNKFHILPAQDEAGREGVAIRMTLMTGDTMTIAISADHATDLAIGIAQYLVGDEPPEVEPQ